jgi:xanthine permease
MLSNGVVVGSVAAVGLNLLFNSHAAENTIDDESVGLNETEQP